jgi:glutathione S-transferase
MPESELGQYRPVSSDNFAELYQRLAPPSGPSGWLSEEEQAAKDCVSVATLRRRRAYGYGPQPIRFGRKFLYRCDASESWLAAQEATAEEKSRQPVRRGGRR